MGASLPSFFFLTARLEKNSLGNRLQPAPTHGAKTVDMLTVDMLWKRSMGGR